MSNLEKPYRNHIIWSRYKYAMKWLAIGTSVALILTFVILWRMIGPLPIHFVIATSLGMFFMVMLTAALMGLVFVSSATEHDEDTIDSTGEAE